MSDSEFWETLERRGATIAIDPADGAPISYARLAEMADAFASRLPAARQLVALEARNEASAIVAYLACLRHGHPVIILSAESIADGRIVGENEPNWLYTKDNGAWRLSRATDRTDTPFADELSVLLSTSGTTGAPKLVKLSYGNIASNAAAIAEYLELTGADCAITTLDFCYSYGMSVVNSYLSVGARILLTDEPVVSKRFWSLFESKRATSLALVPSHFDLLDRIDFAGMDLPTLRYVTQAGGKLHADKVKRYAHIAQSSGWSLYVMYGQTEASPRISYVPPRDLPANLESIGRPVPGGEIVLLDDAGGEIAGAGKPGELVYKGPNVMLGYAESRTDLAKPRDTFALRTGDIAQRQDNGYFRIVGRLNRFIKLYGLRINLDEVESQLRHAGHAVHCTGNDQALALFFVDDLDQAAIKAFVQDRYNIQASHVFLKRLDEIPLLASGKVNYRALAAQITAAPPDRAAKLSVREMFVDALGDKVQLRETDSFTSVGGDSLSYLNISLRLEEALGYLPEDWERRSIQELERLRPTGSPWMRLPVEMIVRVVAIFSVVANHLVDAKLDGGAIVLIMLVGYSLAKYDSDRLPTIGLGDFLRSKLPRILGLYYLIVIGYFVLTWGRDGLADTVPWLLLVPNYDELTTGLYAYWFIGAYAQLLLLIGLAWQIPVVKRLFADRKAAFGYVFVVIAFAVALLARRETPASLLYRNTFAILHICLLGWCAFYARSIQDKALVSVLAVLAVILFWSDPSVEWKPIYFDAFLLGACFAVTWLGGVPLPRRAAAFLMWLASISFYVYLMHMIPVGLLSHYVTLKDHAGWRDKLMTAAFLTVVGFALSVILAALASRAVSHVEGRFRLVRADRPAQGA
jgi:acyl-coenzyme A synthetase/AMP-(fatty) acid ligase/peptidoglycan/LPS O-acetylase OafA/YrhL